MVAKSEKGYPWRLARRLFKSSCWDYPPRNSITQQKDEGTKVPHLMGYV